ncbi:MAG: ribbon-helix-helix protein, CopG family [Desulfobacteraceae bacterium]|nr:ribbon-helix-helix protein, CopG family [Desulfobacteraceae bacterium]
MRRKRKLSVTIDEETSIAIDRASKACHVPKSQLAREAFRMWLKKQTQELMAKGYEEMAKEDKEFAELYFDAQREILP